LFEKYVWRIIIISQYSIKTDLDKLLLIMKNLHKTQPMALPTFINEDWLKQAIGDLDTRQMSIEERYAYE
jgi:hypothetical protein